MLSACPGRCAAWSIKGVYARLRGLWRNDALQTRDRYTHTAFATVPDQRCTASLSLALHRIRDTSRTALAAAHRAVFKGSRKTANIQSRSGVIWEPGYIERSSSPKSVQHSAAVR
jgi:hypothetical protein